MSLVSVVACSIKLLTLCVCVSPRFPHSAMVKSSPLFRWPERDDPSIPLASSFVRKHLYLSLALQEGEMEDDASFRKQSPRDFPTPRWSKAKRLDRL